MKFSWKWLNKIIDLKKINLQEVIDKLTLAGFEIDEIKHIEKNRDTIIDIDITANRQDIYCIIGLAQEISTIFNIPYNIKKQYNYFISNTNIKSKSIKYLCIDTITNIKNTRSPQWLINYLKGCHIIPSNILDDIHEYIKIKWGIDIHIFDAKKISSEHIYNTLFKIHKNIMNTIVINNCHINKNPIIELTKYKNILISANGININNTLKHDTNTCNVVIYLAGYNIDYLNQLRENNPGIWRNKKNHLDLSYHIIQAYNETLTLLRIYTKGIHGKSYKYLEKTKKYNTITIKKKTIHQILGNIKNPFINFLSINEILNILQQLNLQPSYNNLNKEFKVNIPKYRYDDLTRPIDIIEEIGRVYGFSKFISIRPKKTKHGIVNKNTKTIKQIRKILKDIGLNETVNHSLNTLNKNSKDTQINIYNPLIKDQNNLQAHIASNLINANKYNINQNNENNEFFEIGRVFSLNKKIYQENIHISGLMGNQYFNRDTWNNKATAMNWFQAKGLLEIFFERLYANIRWKSCIGNIESNLMSNIKDKIHIERSTYILNQNTQEIIGILAELQQNYQTYYPKYIFEINFALLNKSLSYTKNTEYLFKNYSTYPSITRDISISLNKLEYIHDIKCKILNQQYPFIESIYIFNEYKKTNTHKRNIGLRIIYRSNHKTLQENDIVEINQDLINLLQGKIK